MERNLIIRAACKYKQWIDKERDKPCETDHVIKTLRYTVQKAQEIEEWLTKLAKGATPRVQTSTYSNDQYFGIVSKHANDHILTDMVPYLIEQMNGDVRYVEHACATLGKLQEPAILELSIQNSIDEIRAICDGWETKYKNGHLCIIVQNVILEDEGNEVGLGDFSADIDLLNPLASLRIGQIHGPESEGGYYHPHVSGSNLCTGDGEEKMRTAICQGRLEDFFRVIEAILRTYNPDSPYEALTQWYDPNREDQFYCECCGEWRPDEESCWCDNCQEIYCNGCGEDGSCCEECGEWQCGMCVHRCASCSENFCLTCIKECNGCLDRVCEQCLELCVGGCDERHCDKCDNKCTNCGDAVCESCIKQCPSCDEKTCNSCLDSTCEACLLNVCSCCRKSCDSCGNVICKECDLEECDDCHDELCGSCKDDHSCLLSEVKSTT